MKEGKKSVGERTIKMVSLKENKWLMKGVFELLKHMVVRETTKWLKPGTKRLVVGIGCENMKWM